MEMDVLPLVKLKLTMPVQEDLPQLKTLESSVKMELLLTLMLPNELLFEEMAENMKMKNEKMETLIMGMAETHLVTLNTCIPVLMELSQVLTLALFELTATPLMSLEKNA